VRTVATVRPHSFDVDSECMGYINGSIWMTQRCWHALNMSYNTLDTKRNDEGYDRRLLKYATVGMAIHIPGFELENVDGRTLSIAVKNYTKCTALSKITAAVGIDKLLLATKLDSATLTYISRRRFINYQEESFFTRLQTVVDEGMGPPTKVEELIRLFYRKQLGDVFGDDTHEARDELLYRLGFAIKYRQVCERESGTFFDKTTFFISKSDQSICGIEYATMFQAMCEDDSYWQLLTYASSGHKALAREINWAVGMTLVHNVHKTMGEEWTEGLFYKK
jgi:hypothetical protein